MKYILVSLFSGITVFIFAFIGHHYVLEHREIFQDYLSLDVTKAINEYRSTNNLAPVVQNPAVCDLATSRAFEISEGFSHILFLERFDNPEYWKYFQKVKFSENISKDISTGSGIVKAWINSPKHKEILDADFDHGCVVCYKFYCVFNTTKIL